MTPQEQIIALMHPKFVVSEENRTYLMKRFLEKVNKTSSCWLWTGAKQHPKRSQPIGYGVMLVRPRPRYAMLAHRLSWELFRSPVPDALRVLHKCDNPPCVNPDHLFLGTQGDNMEDCVSKGRKEKGESHFRARLTESQVLEIRGKHESGIGYPTLAKEYRVGKTTIEDIVTGKTWKHVKFASHA